MKLWPIIVALFLIPSQAFAVCGDRDAFVSRLHAEKWNERRSFVGVTTGGTMLEIYLNHETGTFTVMETRPQDNRACVRAAGDAGQILDPQLDVAYPES